MEFIHRVLDPRPIATIGDYVGLGGGAGLSAARRVEPESLIELIGDAGLRGRGGAGFPTGIKWATVAASRSDDTPTTVVVNAAEGEPGTFKDRALLRTNPYRVIEGAAIAALAVGSPKVVIGIKATFRREIQRVVTAIGEMRAAGWLDEIDVDLVLGPSSYLFGEETGLLEVIEGRQPFPRVTPPYRRGIDDDDSRSAGGVDLATVGGSGEPPALVDNVETLANVPLIVQHGVDWFRELGTPESPGTLVCTVSGATRRHGVGEVAMGTTLREVIDGVGLGVESGRRIRVVACGTANTLIPETLLDTPLTYEAMGGAGTGLGSAGFIVFDDRTDPVAVAHGISRFLAVESCGQCEPCKHDGEALSVGLAALVTSDSDERQLSTLRRLTETVTIGARCALATQQADVVTSMLDLFGTEVAAHLDGTTTPADPVLIAPMVDLSGGRSTIDSAQRDKQLDWSTDDVDSGTSPAALLGDTPVDIRAIASSGDELGADGDVEEPGALLDEAHDLLDRLLHEAFRAEGSERDPAVEKLAHLMRVHVDVTRRIFYPMARRHGGDEGASMADDAESQESALLSALERVRATTGRDEIADLAAELREHATREDAIVELLRSTMTGQEREELEEGLGEARVTSRVDDG